MRRASRSCGWNMERSFIASHPGITNLPATSDKLPRTMASTTLHELASLLNVSLPQSNPTLNRVATLTEAAPTDLSFIGSDAYLKEFAATRAGAVLVDKKVKLPADSATPMLIVENADLAVAKVLERFAPPVPRPAMGRHASAIVAPSATIGENCRIGANVIIGDDSRIGKNCVFHPGVYIGSDVTIGDDCEFFPHVVVRERITVGTRVIIHASSVLGSDGFGYRWDGKQHAKIPQIGTVIIEDDVEIGSCVCVDRAKFSATRVGRGTKIDNLVQVAHNCQVGPHCMMAGQSGLAGSVTLGTGVVMGGQCAIRDHT